MNFKSATVNFAIFAALIIFIEIIVFPVSSSIINNEPEVAIDKYVPFRCKILKTVDKDISKFYYVENNDGEKYVVQSERSLILGRYRINRAMPIADAKEFGLADMMTEYTVTIDKDDLKVDGRREWRRFYPVLFGIFIVILSVFYRKFKIKKA